MTEGQREANSQTKNSQTRPAKQEFYQIRIEGHLAASWSSWFEEMDIRHEENGETVLSGPIVDQAALHGVLMKIRDLGLTLIKVKRVKHNQPQIK
jgi:hypothetical protein